MGNQVIAKYPDWVFVSESLSDSDSVLLKNEICGHTIMVGKREIKRGVWKGNCEICRTAKHLDDFATRKKGIQRRKFEKELCCKTEQMQMKECKICGKLFFGFEVNKTCSKECSKQNEKEIKNRYKRIKFKKARTEESCLINLPFIFERDNGICWICGGKCDINANYLDNNYPSIDHVIPISKGGKDCLDNVKLAHRVCNSIKNSRTDMTRIKEVIAKHSPIV